MKLEAALAWSAYKQGNWEILARHSKNKKNPWWFIDEVILGDKEDE